MIFLDLPPLPLLIWPAMTLAAAALARSLSEVRLLVIAAIKAFLDMP
jgi:hypothetical protein